jgi:hypothetical protein
LAPRVSPEAWRPAVRRPCSLLSRTKREEGPDPSQKYREHQKEHRKAYTGNAGGTGLSKFVHASHKASVNELQKHGVCPEDVNYDKMYRNSSMFRNLVIDKQVDNKLMDAHKKGTRSIQGFVHQYNGKYRTTSGPQPVNITKQIIRERLRQKVLHSMLEGASGKRPIDTPAYLNYLRTSCDRLGLDFDAILLSKGMSNMSTFGQSNSESSSTGAGGSGDALDAAWTAFDAACDAADNDAAEDAFVETLLAQGEQGDDSAYDMLAEMEAAGGVQEWADQDYSGGSDAWDAFDAACKNDDNDAAEDAFVEALLDQGEQGDDSAYDMLAEMQAAGGVQEWADRRHLRGVRKDGKPDMRFSANKTLDEDAKLARRLQDEDRVEAMLRGVRKDGKPDMRFSANKTLDEDAKLARRLQDEARVEAMPRGVRKDGKPDMRFGGNRSSNPKPQIRPSGGGARLRNDGQPDMRFAANRVDSAPARHMGPLRGDGQPDMRYRANCQAAVSPMRSSPSQARSPQRMAMAPPFMMGGMGMGGGGGMGLGGGMSGGGTSGGGRCQNGSLDMRFACNRGQSKWG